MLRHFITLPNYPEMIKMQAEQAQASYLKKMEINKTREHFLGMEISREKSQNLKACSQSSKRITYNLNNSVNRHH